MAINLQQGTTGTLKLKFTNADGSAALPPSSGGSVSSSPSNKVHAVLVDQDTVTIQANLLGDDTVTYNGPQGLAAAETVHVVATTAASVAFDESSLTVT